MKQCPRCASEISSLDKKCPRCGMPISMMNFEESVVEENKQLTKERRKLEKQQQKQAKKAEKKERKLRESVSDTDFSKFASNGENASAVSEKKVKGLSERKKRKLEKETTPEFELDENGEFYIDTEDTQIVDTQTAKILEERFSKTKSNSYSVKKERGDYRQPRLKWWEIYKVAERSFAKRKIKKEVNKASKIKPDFIKKSKLLLLAVFFGWTGAHNFYAKNYKKGWLSIVSFIVWVGVISLAQTIPFFASISVSIGGFAGFINVVWIWFGDVINICFNSFKYRIQKEAFIFKLNIETRAKLHEKYIDLELYKKPWWVRLKAWWGWRKRDWQEAKRERHQEKIDREKRKLKKQQEKAKIDAEIFEAEQKESELIQQEKEATEEKQNKKDISKYVDASVLSDISGFEVSGTLEEKPKPQKKKAKAKFETKKQNKKRK